MDRRITVIGKGRALVKPDQIEVSMRLETRDKNYSKAIGKAADRVKALHKALEAVGFTEDDVRTSDFSVRTTSEFRGSPVGGRKKVDTGFEVSQRVNIKFDLDLKRLSKTLGVISHWSGSDPDLSVYFTAKDPNMIKDMVLKSAAESARRQAEVLCEASGVKLGLLVSVNYSWTDSSFRSRTVYRDSMSITRDRSKLAASNAMDAEAFVDMQPDDIDVSDSATFVWAIE